MKSTLKILKNNIFTIIVIFVFIIGMFCISYVKKVYWDNNDEAAYGERTEGVENHEISDKQVDEIKSKIKEDSDVKDVSYSLGGRTIDLTITVNNDVSVSDAKKMGKNILTYFTEDDLSYYALNIDFIKEDKSLDNFPISGYKHYSNPDISWTKDREVTGNETK